MNTILALKRVSVGLTVNRQMAKNLTVNRQRTPIETIFEWK